MSKESSVAAPNVIAVAVFHSRQGQILTVRKRDTSIFLLPGGHPRPGEDMLATVIREVHEEVQVVVTPDSLTHLGTFTCRDANHPERDVTATVFTCSEPVSIAFPGAEIVELAWLTPSSASVPLAPLITDHVLPALGPRN